VILPAGDLASGAGGAPHPPAESRVSPIFASEYDYAVGSVLLPVSGVLTPDQAAPYQSALSAIVGSPAQPVKAA
jgi:hypothetical protein